MMDSLNSTTIGTTPGASPGTPRTFAQSVDPRRAPRTADLPKRSNPKPLRTRRRRTAQPRIIHTTTIWEEASMSGDALLFWSGHLPATRTALEIILNRAASGQTHSTVHERVFATLCEFRATLANGGLHRQYVGGAPRKLKDVCCALNAVGAVENATVVEAAIVDLERNKSRASHDELLQQLAMDLLVLGPSLDRALADFAPRVVGRID